MDRQMTDNRLSHKLTWSFTPSEVISCERHGFIEDFFKFFTLHFPHTNVSRHKFDLSVKKSKVNLQSSFELTWQMQSPWCFILRFGSKSFSLLEKKCFYHIWAWLPTYGPWRFVQIFNPPMKFEEIWPRGFRGEVLQRCPRPRVVTKAYFGIILYCLLSGAIHS